MKKTCENCTLEQRFFANSKFCQKCPNGKKRINTMERERKSAIKSQTSYRGGQQ